MRSHFLKLAGPVIAAGLLSAAAPLCAGPNLVLIGWDTLRADHVGALGYKRATTPNLDALARDSFLFTNAVSQASWTLPSFMSLFTGLYPSEHGVTNKFKLPAAGSTGLEPAALSTAIVTMAQLFKANGYRTAAFTGGAGLGGSFGFSRGFDVYADSRDFAGFGTTFPEALDWLGKNGGAPYFLFVHGYDTHPFHDLEPAGPVTFVTAAEKSNALKLRPRHEKFRLRLLDGRRLKYTRADVQLWTDVYDEKILRADRMLGDFLGRLAAVGSTDTVVVLLSDHGEELFDHGGVDHGMTLYDEVIRVPLLIRVPGRPGGRIAQQVRAIDVFPTLIELLGLKTGEDLREQLRGTSLLGQIDGAAKALDAFSETDYLFHFDKRAVRKSSGLKLTLDGFTQKKEFYDTAADPLEKKDLFDSEPAGAYLLEMELFNWSDRLAPPR